MTIHLLAFAPNTRALRSHPLSLEGPGSSCSLRLRSLPGATGVQVALTNGDGLLLRAEVASEGDELVEIEIEWETGGQWLLSSAGRRVLLLPSDGDEEPTPILRPAYKAKQLDVALVVDGTLRGESAGTDPAAASCLLSDRERWGAHVDQLVEMIAGLSTQTGADLRVAVVAFGDHPVPGTSAPDLRPVYHLYPSTPDERFLQRETAEPLRSRLRSLPSTSGGDFVDSLADALAACRALRWRGGSRKLLVITGDSPGYSILHPSPLGADAQVRERDVDVEVVALHGDGVEALTIYHAPKVEGGAAAFLRPFVEHTRGQYQRIASRPDLAFEASSFDPTAAVRALRSQVLLVGRGASPGILSRSNRDRTRRARG